MSTWDLKIGDKVKVVGNKMKHGFRLGQIITINEMGRYDTFYCSGNGSMTPSYWVYISDVEPIPQQNIIKTNIQNNNMKDIRVDNYKLTVRGVSNIEHDRNGDLTVDLYSIDTNSLLKVIDSQKTEFKTDLIDYLLEDLKDKGYVCTVTKEGELKFTLAHLHNDSDFV